MNKQRLQQLAGINKLNEDMTSNEYEDSYGFTEDLDELNAIVNSPRFINWLRDTNMEAMQAGKKLQQAANELTRAIANFDGIE